MSPFALLRFDDSSSTHISLPDNSHTSKVSKMTHEASQFYRNNDLQAQPQNYRKHRPGKNSYLKVMFENDDFLNRLYSTIIELHLSSQGESLSEDHQGTEMESFHASNESILPNIRIRSLDSLHMTLFFGGEILSNKQLSRDEIRTWYTQIQDRFAESGFFCKCSPHRERQQQQPKEEFWFQFVRLRAFPPGRNYLIVAELDASPAWHTLYHDLRTIARDSECFKETRLSNKKRWVPHITLANINIHPRAGATATRQFLDKALESLRVREEKIVASGISIGGPLPLNDELDWNFAYYG